MRLLRCDCLRSVRTSVLGPEVQSWLIFYKSHCAIYVDFASRPISDTFIQLQNADTLGWCLHFWLAFRDVRFGAGQPISGIAVSRFARMRMRNQAARFLGSTMGLVLIPPSRPSLQRTSPVATEIPNGGPPHRVLRGRAIADSELSICSREAYSP
jgi:hypothetical protein